MATVVYGTHYFNKNLGSYGEKVTCSNCNSTYKMTYIKQNRWFHIDYIPLIPLTAKYAKLCPICGDGDSVKAKVAKAEIAASTDGGVSELKAYAKHFKADKKYEFWYKDLTTGEEFCIGSELKKKELKQMLKNRGLKMKAIEINEM